METKHSMDYGRGGETSDEFLFFIPNVPSVHALRLIVQRFKSAIENFAWERIHPLLRNRWVKPAADVGAIALFFSPMRDENTDPEYYRNLAVQLIKAADELQYRAKRRAKRGGKDCPAIRTAYLDKIGVTSFRPSGKLRKKRPNEDAQLPKNRQPKDKLLRMRLPVRCAMPFLPLPPDAQPQAC